MVEKNKFSFLPHILFALYEPYMIVLCVCVYLCACVCVSKDFNWSSPRHTSRAPTHSHTSTHSPILRPLSSINTFPLQITQQINHHGYSNIIIAVLEGSSDWWCLQGHLEIDNYRENMACANSFSSRMDVGMLVWTSEQDGVWKTEREDVNVRK